MPQAINFKIKTIEPDSSKGSITYHQGTYVTSEGDIIAIANFLGVDNLEVEGSLILSDFEVHPSYRGKNLSVSLLKECKEFFNKIIYTNGKFSKSGFHAYSKMDTLTILPGYEPICSKTENYEFYNWEL